MTFKYHRSVDDLINSSFLDKEKKYVLTLDEQSKLFPLTFEKKGKEYTIGGTNVMLMGYSVDCNPEPKIGCHITVIPPPATKGGRRMSKSRRRSRPNCRSRSRPRHNRRRSRKN